MEIIKMSKLILKVTIEHITDLDANVSLLEGKRLEAYKRGSFEFIGIRAIAEIQIDDLLGAIELTSTGIWGIETDSEDIEINEKEQLEELKDLCEKYILIPKTEITKAFKKENINHKEVDY